LRLAPAHQGPAAGTVGPIGQRQARVFTGDPDNSLLVERSSGVDYYEGER